jgi:hypothetical protein
MKGRPFSETNANLLEITIRQDGKKRKKIETITFVRCLSPKLCTDISATSRFYQVKQPTIRYAKMRHPSSFTLNTCFLNPSSTYHPPATGFVCYTSLSSHATRRPGKGTFTLAKKKQSSTPCLQELFVERKMVYMKISLWRNEKRQRQCQHCSSGDGESFTSCVKICMCLGRQKNHQPRNRVL